MKRICVAVLGQLAISGSAFAADLPALLYKGPGAEPVPASSWTGLYVGGHLGGAWDNSDWFFPFDSINSVAQRPVGIPYQGGFPNTPSGLAHAIANGYQGPSLGPFNVSSGSNSASGFLAGGQIGYNYQMQNWVLGVEGEASWVNLKGSNLDPVHPTVNQNNADFVGILGGRVGYAFDRLLIYGKAGGAWANSQYSVFSDTTFKVGNGSPAPTTVTAGTMVDAAPVNRFGFMLGAGVEYALTPQLSVKAEYEYLDFGRQRVTVVPSSAVVSPFDEDIRQRVQIAEVGFNYKLDAALTAASTWAAHSPFDQVGQLPDNRRFYGDLDYVLWWVKGAPLSVPLVSTGPESSREGILNSSASTILYGAPLAPAVGGNNTQNFKGLSGARLTLGYWLDDAHRFALEAGGFALQQGNGGLNMQSDSTGSPALVIPMYNTFLYLPEGRCGPPSQRGCGTGVGEDRAPVALPGDLTGAVSVSNTLRLWGLNANAIENIIRTPAWDVSALGGFRYLNISEDFNMSSSLSGVAGSPFAGQSGFAVDNFATRNHFYGALLGLRALGRYGPFSLESTLTAALGVNSESVNIEGAYLANNFLTTTGPYGIFATPANSGTTTSNQFSVVPEAKIKLGYDITSAIRLTVGYDFLYASNVVRPTDQIDRNLVKGQYFQEDRYSTSFAYPQRLNKATDFYAQGLSIGLVARF